MSINSLTFSSSSCPIWLTVDSSDTYSDDEYTLPQLLQKIAEDMCVIVFRVRWQMFDWDGCGRSWMILQGLKGNTSSFTKVHSSARLTCRIHSSLSASVGADR